MKICFLFLFILLNSLIIHAQENFEGKIVYKSDVTGMDQKNVSVEVFVKGHKMLLISSEKENKTPGSHCLYDFQKGICYTFSVDDSIIFTDHFDQAFIIKNKSNEADTNDNVINVIGYKAKKVLYQTEKLKRNPFKKIEAWFCDELIFKVPDSIHPTIPPIVFFNGISISLKIRLSMEGISEDGSPLTILIYASEITKTALSDSIFEIPRYFKIVDRNKYTDDLLRKFKEIDSELPQLVPAPDKANGKKPH